MLARCAAALYADLYAFSTSDCLAARRSFFHWNQDLSLGMLRGWMARTPAWWGNDLALLRRALLLDPASEEERQHIQHERVCGPFDYGDDSRIGETDWSGTVASNSGDKNLIEMLSEEEAAQWSEKSFCVLCVRTTS